MILQATKIERNSKTFPLNLNSSVLDGGAHVPMQLSLKFFICVFVHLSSVTMVQEIIVVWLPIKRIGIANFIGKQGINVLHL